MPAGSKYEDLGERIGFLPQVEEPKLWGPGMDTLVTNGIRIVLLENGWTRSVSSIRPKWITSIAGESVRNLVAHVPGLRTTTKSSIHITSRLALKIISFDPSGNDRLTVKEAQRFGFPAIHAEIEVWDSIRGWMLVRAVRISPFPNFSIWTPVSGLPNEQTTDFNEAGIHVPWCDLEENLAPSTSTTAVLVSRACLPPEFVVEDDGLYGLREFQVQPCRLRRRRWTRRENLRDDVGDMAMLRSHKGVRTMESEQASVETSEKMGVEQWSGQSKPACRAVNGTGIRSELSSIFGGDRNSLAGGAQGVVRGNDSGSKTSSIKIWTPTLAGNGPIRPSLKTWGEGPLQSMAGTRT
ncbi:hypothetical protein FB45DRAFT_1009931 [Roridomyces roridus]|uniref:Uncharacterized protein n=1 Tax=Roridomyces roridus TaxID=1738132 RepID=A0AAD7B5B9_9AGAR|nr:hypothetical protein FB45DRAFT_1009931 [Roridomyces roridus]